MGAQARPCLDNPVAQLHLVLRPIEERLEEIPEPFSITSIKTSIGPLETPCESVSTLKPPNWISSSMNAHNLRDFGHTKWSKNYFHHSSSGAFYFNEKTYTKDCQRQSGGPLALVPKLAIRWRLLQMLLIWPPGCVTCIVTLSCIAVLALRVSIELVSSSARVTSV